MSDTPVETKPEPTTVLGTDPAETPAEPKPTPTPSGEKPKSRSINEDEYVDMQNKAKAYELIQSDPQLASHIYDHFRSKTGRVTPESKETKEEPNKPVDETSAQLKALTNRLAVQEVQLFAQAHPDMKEHASKMQELITKYGMGLEDAYNFAKLAKPQTPSNSEQPKAGSPPQPTVEIEGGEVETVSSSEQELLAKIHDPKATPQLDDAIDLAWKLAKQKSK